MVLCRVVHHLKSNTTFITFTIYAMYRSKKINTLQCFT